MKKRFLLLITCLVSVVLSAQLRLPSVLSSGVVLQQNDSVLFWGWGFNGQKITILPSWNNTVVSTTINNTGRWKVKLKTPAAGGPYNVDISSAGLTIQVSDVLIGEVWLCSGQSNMEWSYNNNKKTVQDELPVCYNKNIRFFHIPRTASEYPQDNVTASWKICDSAQLKSFSAVGYYFGKRLQQQLNVPIGLINASWGGTPAESWTPTDVINNNDTLKQSASLLKEVPWGPIQSGVLYNGMLSGITRFSIAGAIWYQGEANTINNAGYAQLLTSMIDAWRVKWGKPLPFYYVQIAPFKYARQNEGALVQEQQSKVMQHPKTGMVVVTDLIDSVKDIHPGNKKDVGLRLANWALSETYGKTSLAAYKSPVYKSMEIQKNKIVLYFNNAVNGLMAKDKLLKGFVISGETENWLPAEAKIENDKIIVWNSQLKKPKQIRFGFGNTIIGNVFNKEGLPLCPFRTDNWNVEQLAEKY